MPALWDDTLAIPAAIRATLEAADGFAEVVALLATARRVVVSGNGAAWYVALAAWLTSLESRPVMPAPVVALPAGVITSGRFEWRDGDVLLMVSASGELRDLVELLADPPARRPRAVGLITATGTSTLARAADAVATTRLQRAVAFTHSQAYAANFVVLLDVIASWTGDADLVAVVGDAADAVARSIAASDHWSPFVELPRMATVFGTGVGWAAALEGALLLREVARIPAEGAETREAATSSMFAMGAQDLVVSLPLRDDELVDEAERVCESRGAQVIRAPGCDVGDPRLAPLLAFPATAKLAIALAELQGVDPDAPESAAAYYETARQRVGDDSAAR
jgi:fructoselysine-6-P-deglycase FrlB-like protein